MYNGRSYPSYPHSHNQAYPITPSALDASSSSQAAAAASLPHAWINPVAADGTPKRLNRQPSQGLLDAAKLLEPIMRPHGGRSAPINQCATSPVFKNTRAIPDHIAYADYMSQQFSVGDFVTAQHYIRRDRKLSPGKVGQIIKIHQDTVHCTTVFTVAFVDEYNKKKTSVEYSIWNGDALTAYQGDVEALVDLHSGKCDTAPTMGKAHAWPSAALATPVVHGEIESPKRRRH